MNFDKWLATLCTFRFLMTYNPVQTEIYRININFNFLWSYTLYMPEIAKGIQFKLFVIIEKRFSTFNTVNRGDRGEVAMNF